jgi:hypothetical protein
MRWRRWLALFGVLALGFTVYVFFTGEWPAAYDPLPRCAEATPASLWSPPIHTPKAARGQLVAPSREAVSVETSIDHFPPGVNCDLRRCKLKHPAYLGQYLVDSANPPCRPALRSASFFVHAHATDYFYVPAYGGGFALFFTVLLFGLVAVVRAGRRAYRRGRKRNLRPGT